MMVNMENVSVMYVNSNFVKETGIAKTNAVGKSMYDLFEVCAGAAPLASTTARRMHTRDDKPNELLMCHQIVCVADNKREAIKKEVYDAVIKGINDFSVDGAYVVDGQSM